MYKKGDLKIHLEDNLAILEILHADFMHPIFPCKNNYDLFVIGNEENALNLIADLTSWLNPEVPYETTQLEFHFPKWKDKKK